MRKSLRERFTVAVKNKMRFRLATSEYTTHTCRKYSGMPFFRMAVSEKFIFWIKRPSEFLWLWTSSSGSCFCIANQNCIVNCFWWRTPEAWASLIFSRLDKNEGSYSCFDFPILKNGTERFPPYLYVYWWGWAAVVTTLFNWAQTEW